MSDEITPFHSNINPLAYQANALVRSPLKFTHVEARIFALALGTIHARHTELPPISIDVRDVVTSKPGGSLYAAVKEAAQGLMKKRVEIETMVNGEIKFVGYNLIDTLGYDTKTGMLTGAFAKGIEPFLLQLQEKFTRVEIQTLLSLKSAHSHRLYWLLKSWEKPQGKIKLEVEKMRQLMLAEDADKMYPTFAEFKRNVLKPALQEFQELDPAWEVEMREIKQRKWVTELEFIIPVHRIKKAETAEETSKSPKAKLTLEEMGVFKEWLRNKYEPLVTTYDRLRADYEVTEPQARAIVKAVHNEADYLKLTKVLHQVKLDVVNKVPIKKLGAYTVQRLKEALEVYAK
ncbi:hypothetical protein GCM10022408_37750 [Hymenobacter fastidiosus]|uniref:Initiator Rep protein WH1 domain-containing protein n=1 Tax=Hymenobacter fastidiosus TaxID=486264 RepID=A0ABP7T384_9BACT